MDRQEKLEIQDRTTSQKSQALYCDLAHQLKWYNDHTLDYTPPKKAENKFSIGAHVPSFNEPSDTE